MSHVDKTRFEGTHYLGLPADINDSIVYTRVQLAKKIPAFCNSSFSLVDVVIFIPSVRILHK